MEIYVVRHGEALEGDIDELRELCEKGEKQAKKVGKKLKKLNINIDEIFSSPMRRAIQTAEIIAKEIKFKNKINITESLMPFSDPDEILNHILYINKDKNKDKILVVGHQPFLGNFINFISSSESSEIKVKRGCLCKIVIENKKFKKIEQII